MTQQRSRSPRTTGEVIGNTSEFREVYGKPLGKSHNTLGTATLGVFHQGVNNDYYYVEGEDEYGNPRSSPTIIGLEVVGGNGMFEKMTDKELLRTALARMRDNSDLGIGNELENSLTELFNTTGAPFSDQDWLTIKDSVLGQSWAELASSFLDTLSLADPSSNYYGERRRNVINELWEKGESIDEMINIHSIRFTGKNGIGGPRYCVSYGIIGTNTKFNCTILMTLPASIDDQDREQNTENNQRIQRAILDNSDLLQQLIACYG